MSFRAPMLALPSTSAGNRQPVDHDHLMSSGDWVAEVKYDGIRAYAMADAFGKIKLINRNGVDISTKFPEVTRHQAIPNLWLDGEIVAEDDKFETVLMRDKQQHGPAIQRLVESHPCLFVAFDMPGLSQRDWAFRRQELENLAWPGGWFMLSAVSESVEYKDRIFQLGLEGVICKRKTSRYRFNTRSHDWVKFKREDRVSCLVAGYTTGTGSRSHFGAMHLALLDPGGTPVPVGRVGTGFTEREIDQLKSSLDRGELLVVEVKCLGLTGTDQLRQPVFLGVRNDLDPYSCTTDQLAALPRS